MACIYDYSYNIYYTAAASPVHFGSTAPSVVTIDAQGHAQAVGTGEATLYAVFDGDDDYRADSVWFTLNLQSPDTLTLTANGNGTVAALLGSSAPATALLTTINASSSFTNGTQNFDNIVTVTLEDVDYDANKGWYGPASPRPVEVAPVSGVTVTGYMLYFSATDPVEYEGSSFEVALRDNVVKGGDLTLGSVGITKIEVYGPSNAAAGSDSVVALNEAKDTLIALPGAQVQVVATAVDGNYLSGWSPINRTPANRLSDTATITMPASGNFNLTATFAQNPLLTLNANQGGSVTIDGVVTELDQMMAHLSDPIAPYTSYSVFLQSDGVLKDNVKTLTNAQAIALAQRIAQATGNNNIRVLAYTHEVFGSKYLRLGKPDGNTEGSTVYMTSNSPYTIYYVNTFDLLPETYLDGVAAGTTANTYRVLPGTTVNVTATPDSAHYFQNWTGEADTNVNTAVTKTLTMGTTQVDLIANFHAKPTLTLAQNESEWGSVTVPTVSGQTTYTITIDGNTTTNVTFPFEQSVYFSDGLMAVMPNDPVSVVSVQSPNATIRINEPFTGSKNLDYLYNGDGVSSKTVTCTAVPGAPALPAGVAEINSTTYRVDYGQTVTINAQATTLHHVQGWQDENGTVIAGATMSDYAITTPTNLFPQKSTVTLSNITADRTARALFGINSYDVTATASLDNRAEVGTGLAMGTVGATYVAQDGTEGQSVTPAASITYTAQGGSQSTLTATPEYGYTFAGWADQNGTVVSTANPYTVTEAATLTATFTVNNYDVTLSGAPVEYGSVSGAGTYEYLTPVEIEALPLTGRHFVEWNDGNTDNPRTVVLTKDTAFAATFAVNYYDVSYAANDAARGTVNGETSGFYRASYMFHAQMVAVANYGYRFDHWSNGSTNPVYEFDVIDDVELVAVFVPLQYTVTAQSADASMGSVEGTATVDYLTPVTLTATPASCHHFVQWSDGNTDNPRALIATKDTTVSALFAITYYEGSESEETCDSYTWNGHTYTLSGDYHDTLAGASVTGCDSVTTLHLTLHYSDNTVETVETCQSYEWHGVTYSESTTTPTYQTSNMYGCDSTVTLHLSIMPAINTVETVEACNSYEWHGVTYTASTTTPTYQTTSVHGCDSTVTLHLTINVNTYGVETVEACDSYYWHGHNYIASTTTPTYHTTNAAGCDSTVTLHLTLGRSTSGIANAEACERYTWHGVTYTESTDEPTYTTTNSTGCPHVATLHLTIHHNSSSEETVEVCDSYEWNGQTRSQSGDYHYTTTNAEGCDSAMTLHLTILRSSATEESAVACDSLLWNGEWRTVSGEYSYSTTNAVGCDSTVTLHLAVYYSGVTTDVVTACDSYTWIDGVTYTASTNEPTFTITSEHCSVEVSLDLTVNYSTTGTDVVEAVDSYTWIDGVTYTASTNEPTFTLTNAAGCDSVVTLNLTITYTPEPVYYSVTLATADATMGSVSPEGVTSVMEGESFTATATALTGRHFVAWVANGVEVSTTNPYTFTVNADVELTATFAYDEVTVVLSVNDATMGTTNPAPGTYTFAVGESATVTATANEHYHLVGWTVNGTPIDNAVETYTVTATPEMAGMTFTVEAVFERNVGIDDVENTDFSIYSKDMTIYIRDANNSDIHIYDVNGRCLRSQTAGTETMEFRMNATGVYLVKVGNAPAKRVVLVR